MLLRAHFGVVGIITVFDSYCLACQTLIKRSILSTLCIV